MSWWLYLLLPLSAGAFAGNVQLGSDSGTLPSSICRRMNESEFADVQVISQWREDQKQPEERLYRAERIVRAWAENTDCFNLLPNDATTANTHRVTITLYELGPHFTLSIPILWSGHTEIKFRIDIESLNENRIVTSKIVHAIEGGSFNIRTLEDAYREFERQLHEIVLEED